MLNRTPGAAYDAFAVHARQLSELQREWADGDDPLPALYLSHGAPPLFDDAVWIDELFAWSQRMPKPRAILIVSAHWESAPLSLSATAAGTELVYDFGGFHPRYYQMTYRTPDASGLASTVAAMLSDREVHQHQSRGLDHGAWVPLMAMYPLGDVPVLQMSLPSDNPHTLLDLGERLAELRGQGVLIIGSGFMTHGLPYMTREMFLHNAVPGWSRDFDAWAADALARGAVDELADFRRLAPAVRFAHPTVEHYTPLFVTLGASGEPERPTTTAIDGFAMGFSKRSVQTI